jgi:hypothetical protein
MVLILPLNHLEKFNQFRIGSYSSSNSYWPILLSMFRFLKNVFIKQN